MVAEKNYKLKALDGRWNNIIIERRDIQKDSYQMKEKFQEKFPQLKQFDSQSNMKLRNQPHFIEFPLFSFAFVFRFFASVQYFVVRGTEAQFLIFLSYALGCYIIFCSVNRKTFLTWFLTIFLRIISAFFRVHVFTVECCSFEYEFSMSSPQE